MPPTGTCPTCRRPDLPLTRAGRVKSHPNPATDRQCTGGRPAPTPGDPR